MLNAYLCTGIAKDGRGSYYYSPQHGISRQLLIHGLGWDTKDSVYDMDDSVPSRYVWCRDGSTGTSSLQCNDGHHGIGLVDVKSELTVIAHSCHLEGLALGEETFLSGMQSCSSSSVTLVMTTVAQGRYTQTRTVTQLGQLVSEKE